MNSIEEEQLKVEIQHIFNSGANETRILEMVKSFINSRKVTSDLSKHIVRKSFTDEQLGDMHLDAYYEHLEEWKDKWF